jgi:hypothetical protein
VNPSRLARYRGQYASDKSTKLFHLIVSDEKFVSLSLASDHALFVRAKFVDDRIEVATCSEFYQNALHIWPENFVVFHIVLINYGLFTTNHRAFGSSGLPNHFLEMIEGLLNVDRTKRSARIPWSSVTLLGGRVDLQTLCQNGYIKPDLELMTFNQHIHQRCRDFLTHWEDRDPNMTLIVIPTASRHYYRPTDARGLARQQATRDNFYLATSVTKISQLTVNHIDSVEKIVMSFFSEGHAAIQAGSMNYGYVPVVLENGFFKTLNTGGFPNLSNIEPCVMGILHGWWKGFGVHRLGHTPFETIRLSGCAGQFNYRLTNGAKDYFGTPYTASVRMSDRHMHPSGPCHVSAMDFTGFDDRLRLFGFTVNMLPRHMVNPLNFLDSLKKITNFILLTQDWRGAMVGTATLSTVPDNDVAVVADPVPHHEPSFALELPEGFPRGRGRGRGRGTGRGTGRGQGRGRPRGPRRGFVARGGSGHLNVLAAGISVPRGGGVPSGPRSAFH